MYPQSARKLAELTDAEVQSEEKELRQLHDAADGNTAIASNYEEGTKRVADKSFRETDPRAI